ncbi:MAG TPA: DUF2207 domain-containing protein [Gemmatimonadales bacterium]
MRPLLLLLGLLLAAAPAAAQRSYAIKSFDATILVAEDGMIDVTETITAEFRGAYNGIYRTIPVKYRSPQGFGWTIQLDLVSVTDAEGRTLRVESSREGHYRKFKIWIPGAEDATRTVVLRYRAGNGLRFFEDHDELYWNITGDEWEVPLEAVTARIELPRRATGVRAIAFNGVYGSTRQEARVAVDGTSLMITMPESLGFREGVTAVVGWDKGVVREPTSTERAAGFLATNWPLALPIPVFLLMFALWKRVGRDPEELPIAVQYQPPDGLTPAEAGALLDHSVDMRDITATIVDLAVAGHLTIEEREEKALFGLIRSQEFVFRRESAPMGGRPLHAHERAVLDGLFESGTTEVELSDLENEFYQHLGDIRSAVFDRLIGSGLLRSRPDKVRQYWTMGGVVLGFLMVALGIGAAAQFDLAPLPVFIGAGLSALIVVVFGQFMPARTVAGARQLEKVRGFEEFLTRVEGDRFLRVEKTPEMFERYLPYAMAFGVEGKWARGFQDIYREPPRWYVGTNPMGFNAANFSSRMSAMSSAAGSALSSSPRSSGGSGFSGGSSGGGGGGGGGGAF